MEFALSLGYPHYELMLADMNFRQYQELLAHQRLKATEREELQAEAEDSRMWHFINKVEAQQKRDKRET